MSFFGSISRFFRTMFGLAEGATERAADKLVSGSPDAIRAQFRKTREDWKRDYLDMREAVADLIRVRESRVVEAKRLQGEVETLQNKMGGAIELYRKNPDPRYRDAYAQLAERHAAAEKRIQELTAEAEAQDSQIEKFKSRLMEIQRQIETLTQEEAETIADIVSAQKVRELNDRLQGLSVASESKSLEAIREARAKAKAMAKLSGELAGTDKADFERELVEAGVRSKYLDVFDVAVGKKAPQVLDPERPDELPSHQPRDEVAENLDKLLQEAPKR